MPLLFDIIYPSSALTNSLRQVANWQQHFYIHTYTTPYLISINPGINKISPVQDWQSTPTYCQLQSHVTQKLEQKSKIKNPAR